MKLNEKITHFFSIIKIRAKLYMNEMNNKLAVK